MSEELWLSNTEGEQAYFRCIRRGSHVWGGGWNLGPQFNYTGKGQPCIEKDNDLYVDLEVLAYV